MDKNIRQEKTEYFITFPIFIALALTIAGYLIKIKTDSVNMGFFLCYILVNLLISVIFTLKNAGKWDILVSFIVTLMLIVIFRDRVLMINQLSALGITALLYLLRKEKIKKYGWIAVTIILMVAWILRGSSVPRYVAISLVLLIIYSFSLVISRNIIYYSAVPLCIVIASIFVPVSKKPYQWNFVRNAVHKVENIAGTAADELEYLFEGLGIESTGYTGYSGKGRLSKGVGDYDREEMLFDQEGGFRKSIVYLKGRSYIKLDDTGFSEEDESDNALVENATVKDRSNGWFALYMNSLYHADVNSKEASFFSRVLTAGMQYKYLRTEDLITPPTLLFISDQSGGDKKGKGYSYRVRYMMIDYASPYFINVIKEADLSDGSYEDYKTIADYTKQIYKLNLRDILTEEEYNVAIQPRPMDEYLDTSFATERMTELTGEITAGAETDYEKACLIEKYLRQYAYSKKVDLTDSENYVDDFLFVTQKGYCVHYAAAMVLMLRIAGVPARYCVGYRHNEVKSHIVPGSESHAWPEAYIKGYGWLGFEPTGAYRNAEQYSWGFGKNYNREAYDQGKSSAAEKNEEEYQKAETDPMNIPTSELDKMNSDRSKEGSRFKKAAVKQFAGYILLMLAVLLFIIILVKLIRLIRFRLLSPEDKLKENVISIIDSFKEKKQDLDEYVKLIDDEEMRENLKSLFDGYRRVRFRGDEATEEMINLSKIMKKYVYRRGL